MSNESSNVSRTPWARYGKRTIDVVAVGLLLICLSPVLLLAAVLVKLTSPGPVFFVQDRAGRDAAVFRLYKFRTMCGDREPDPKELVHLDHPEITSIGRLLRRFKIDELPQLWNVLKGDMSLIGPRPTLPDQVAAYDEFRRQRLFMRPGITGLAQVNGNTAVPWDERILFDIAYVRRCRFATDVGILLRTVLVLLFGERYTTRPFQKTPYAEDVTPPPGYPTTPRNDSPS